MRLIDNFKPKKKSKYYIKNYAKIMNGDLPVFSNFGSDIYASDLVKSAIRSLATEISKLKLQSIKILQDGKVTVNQDVTNSVFNCMANPMMTMSDFLEKVAWKWSLDKNVFIYPVFQNSKARGKSKREIKSLYPLNPTIVEFLRDEADCLYVKMTFENGTDFTIPYHEIIHLRKDFSLNDLMGGNRSGGSDDSDILKILEANNKMIEGIPAAIESSLKMKGVITAKSLMDEAKLARQREEFEKQLEDSSAGLIATDFSADVTPFNIDPVKIEKTTMDFIENKIFRNYGVSIAIVNGDYSETQYNAFYQKTLEPLINKISQAFTYILFDEKERKEGHQIRCFLNMVMTATIQTKLDFVKQMGDRGAITDNEAREVFGYLAYEGGDVRKQSLNYIDASLANDYQMKKSSKEDKNEKE